MLDGWEITFFLTDPNNPDSDGDGYNDGLEIESGSEPNDSFSTPAVAAEFLYPFGLSFMLLTVSIIVIFSKIRKKNYNQK